MSRKELKNRGRSLLKQKSYWINIAVVFFMALNIDSIISIFTTDYEQYFSLFTPANFNWENIKSFILENNGDESITGTILSASITLVEVLIISILRVGGTRYFLKLRKNQTASFGDVFEDFKNKTAGNIATVALVKFLTCMLWTFLGIIPGIIKLYQYAAVEYILALRPDISSTEALHLSKTLMKGNKIKAFVLDLSFTPWFILSFLSLDLLSYLYVTPYYEATYIEFFSNLRDDAIEKQIITPKDFPDYDKTPITT